MRIAVVMKLVPDVVEELVLSEDGKRLERGDIALKANEFDEQALEQALLLKESSGAELTVIAAETGDVDEMLYTALAKGADRALKLVGDGLQDGIWNAQYAGILVDVIADVGADAVLTGVQANDDLDGQLATWLAAGLGWSFATVVSGVEAAGESLIAKKEFAGGLTANLRLPLPAVLGIQASPEPPRYAPISRVRQIMKTQSLEEREVTAPAGSITVLSLRPPEKTGGAEMIEGDVQAKAARIAEVLAQQGI